MDYRELPPELRPLSAWAYFGYELLYAVPVVGWVFLICHAIGARNVNKRSFARSFFCVYIVVAVLALILALTGAGAALFAPRGSRLLSTLLHADIKRSLFIASSIPPIRSSEISTPLQSHAPFRVP